MSRKDTGEGGFLDRWSRRKRMEGEATEAPSPPAPEPFAEPVTENAITPEELAALPTLEEITKGTDITPFLRRGVPAALKSAALRKMWMLTPAIRDHKDLAVDYAWDWNTPGGVPGSTGEVAAKGIADLIERLSDGRRKIDERETPAPVAQDEVSMTEKPELSATEVPSGTAPREPDRRVAAKREADDDPPQRHGGARPT